ncbi:MAG: C-GCAxxG-C-C family protein [Acidimicrobiia bacterium]|nr:C-GCAxxG-C-C family protein [Acidimicrobiia bacterium]
MSVNAAAQGLTERAREYFAVSGNCAQSTFAALNDEFDLNAAGTLKALTAMPGVAIRGETCGAVIGSLAALGTVFGRERLDDREGMTRAVKISRRFCRWFEGEFGGTTCQDVLDAGLGQRFDMASPAELMEYMQCGGPQHCGQVVTRSAVEVGAMISATDRD